jgi:hypothetical protein
MARTAAAILLLALAAGAHAIRVSARCANALIHTIVAMQCAAIASDPARTAAPSHPSVAL